MFFDFDFRSVRRLTGVTTGRRHGQWCFRLISRSRTLRVCADVTGAAATAITVDATAIAVDATTIAVDATVIAVDVTDTANNVTGVTIDATAAAIYVTGVTIDATAAAINVTSVTIDATATAVDATATAVDATAAVIDANATAVDDATDFRHRHLLLLPRTGMVVVLSAVARRYGRISRRHWRRRSAVIPTTDFRWVATSRHSARHRVCGTSLRIATATIGSRNRSERIAVTGSHRKRVAAIGRHRSERVITARFWATATTITR